MQGGAELQSLPVQARLCRWDLPPSYRSQLPIRSSDGAPTGRKGTKDRDRTVLLAPAAGGGGVSRHLEFPLRAPLTAGLNVTLSTV